MLETNERPGSNEAMTSHNSPDDPQKVQQCRSRFCQQRRQAAAGPQARLHTMPPHDARILARIGTARTTSSAKVTLDQK